jgi:outer membrane biosynthesis protein TonB
MHSLEIKIEHWLKERTVYAIAIIISLLLHLLMLLYINRADIFSFHFSEDNEPVNDEVTILFPENKPEKPPMNIVENINFNEILPENADLLSDKNSRAMNEQLLADQRNQPMSEGNIPFANMARPNQNQSSLAQARPKTFSREALVGTTGDFSQKQDIAEANRHQEQVAASNQDMTNQMWHQAEFSADQLGDMTLSTYAWEWAPYINSFKRKLYTVWFAPAAYNQLGLIYGYTIIRFTISRDGKLLNHEVLEHVGHESLQASSENAIKSTFPFKPLPGNFPEETLTITAKMIYPNLREWRR